MSKGKIVIIAAALFVLFGFKSDVEKVIHIIEAIGREWKENNIHLSGRAAVLMDRDTGDLIFSKNPYEKLFPASTTKILTALVVIEYGNLDDKIKVGKEVNMRKSDESAAGIYEGQVLSVRQLLSGLMLASGNDAARTLAIYTAKRINNDKALSNQEALIYFADEMNKKAHQLGTKNSHFVNPHGLHDPKHYTTAYDMAIIARAAMKNPYFSEIVSKNIYSDKTLTFQNRNKLIDEESDYFYKGANGIKTGHTSAAGYCLVSSAAKNERNLIAVVLNSSEQEIWNDSISLLDQGFSLAKK
ncbi:D-alanyl-D-alanine carboxypeptidase family protein [Peribacillus sp. SCS-155]|uniref:D-alanyl-D-alanine carboxypeptidase family protein n=1 Tax=Peribacillus sedimenti TaxID=3115297 RepID=UPI003906586E